MTYVIISIRDEKAEAFGRPFFSTTIGTAIRSFTDEVNRSAEDNAWYRHAADYTMYELGTFDDFDGSFKLLSTPKMLVKGDQVKETDVKKNWSVV